MNKKVKYTAREGSKIIARLSEGLFSHAVDIALWCSIYFLDLATPSSKNGKIWRAEIVADRFLREVNYEVIKNAINTARRNGWIKKSSRHAMPEITQSGKKRLTGIIPQYDQMRHWDGRLHLATYDVPETKADERHLLRDTLRNIGCGRLQDSVWITPYNPVDTLRSFIDHHDLMGTIIVSDIGKDGAIGEEDVRALIVRVYRLEELNQRYIEWLKETEDGIDHWMIIRFLTILKDDPQLPFTLLPPWWKGDKAYNRVKPLLK